MKIPKCCKNCNNRHKGICSCILPYYCNEWVDDDDIKDVGTEIIFEPNEITMTNVLLQKVEENNTKYYCISEELQKENENNKKLGLALYAALTKELEKQRLTDDSQSVIDQLVGKNCEKYSDMYNEYKSYKNKLIELRNYIMNYYDDGVNRSQECNDYIRASCKDILEKMKDLKLI